MTVTFRGSKTGSFLGIQFDLIDETRAVEEVLSLARTNSFSFVVTPNVDHLVRLHQGHADKRLWQVYSRATLQLCDSRVLRLLASISGVPLTLVPGSDLTRSLLEERDKVRAALVIGGDEALMDGLRSLYPNIAWQHHAPPFGLLQNPKAQQEAVQFIESSPASVVFLAIGSPQSELICAALADRRRATGVALCIGASLEFITGMKRRAPLWMQRLGLEWLFRLLSEPTRLWRRYLLDGPAIFRIWWRWRSSSSR